MQHPWRLFASSFALSTLVACGSDDVGIQNPVRDQYGVWQLVEPEGAVCGNGSQYKFFVKYSDKSDNLVVVLEPGGACWDYESCTGAAGIRGAANPNGLRDDHFEFGEAISPFLSSFDANQPTHDWNMVWVPYCTGDVHTGNNTIVYEDPLGEGPDVTFHHAGHEDMVAVTEYLDDNFTHVPQMLVTGCSAGGAGSITNYFFMRNGIGAVEKGYMLNDSGPIFPSGGFSQPLHDKVRESWNTDSILEQLPASFDADDFGSINLALADTFPDDRLATTYFRRDMNFSLYSYERFYDFPPKEEVLSMWNDDTQLLVDMYDTKDNLHYYIPYWRAINDSHCTTLITYAGSEIQEKTLELGSWVKDLLDDKSDLQSAIEAPTGEDE